MGGLRRDPTRPLGADEQATLGVRARVLGNCRRGGIAEWQRRPLRCCNAYRATTEHVGVRQGGAALESAAPPVAALEEATAALAPRRGGVGGRFGRPRDVLRRR